MDKTDASTKENAVVILNMITKITQEFEKKIVVHKKKPKECEELKLLKEKCCDKNVIVSLTAFQAITSLVQRRILLASQTMSTLISLLPSIHHYHPLVSAIGNILIFDLQEQTLNSANNDYVDNSEVLRPLFVMVLKYNSEKSWFEINNFIQRLVEIDSIKIEYKIKLLRPVFRHVFWSSTWRGSPLQLKLFSALMTNFYQKEIINFWLEILMWQEIDKYYCIFLRDVILELLNSKREGNEEIVSALTPFLAQAIKWLIKNGHDPSLWIDILQKCLEVKNEAYSLVLYILSDVILETPPMYIGILVNTCKSIIFSSKCNKYTVYKFLAVVLNWCVNPSPLVSYLYTTVEEILSFLKKDSINWNDGIRNLITNKYFTFLINCNEDVKFALDVMLTCDSWTGDRNSVVEWLKNLKASNEPTIHLKLHSLLHGIILCESNHEIINLCLDILFELIDRYKDISFSHLCLIFYKLGREVDPFTQKTLLFSLPKLAVKKENIPLIVRIIESLKKSSVKTVTPIVIHLYMLLWKFDNRTYTYLHKMLHDPSPETFNWELNLSKAIALREICHLAPHLHAKDLVCVLSNILNQCDGHASGLPSAIAIEAVTELCKAYVIDISGTWNAIQPKLCIDKRPTVVISLCKFFAEIPNLDSSGTKYEKLTWSIVPMIWNYTFFNNRDVVKQAFRALSAFSIESLPLELFPEKYRMDITLPKEPGKDSKVVEDILSLPYVPAQCWIQFIKQIDDDVLKEGGDLLTVIIERELKSLPRNLFFATPENIPSTYTYLPTKSVVRALGEYLRKLHIEGWKSAPKYIKEIIRVLSHEYTNLLPPLDWSFLRNYMKLDSETLLCCLSLLAKQELRSKFGKSIIDDYLKEAQWDSDKVDEIVFLYDLFPFLCKSVSYYTLKSFLGTTIGFSLQYSLENNTDHFEKILQHLIKAFQNSTVPHGHKNLLAKQLEKVLSDIPSTHRIMDIYALCASEFPVKSIENLTSQRDSVDTDSDTVDTDWLRRALIIRCAIGMRSDIKNPLVWLNELTDIAAKLPEEKEFTFNKLLSIIQKRRNCDYKKWIEELMWRIQTSTSNNTPEVTHFLIDLFVSAIIVLSGYDSFFYDFSEISVNVSKKLQMFPQSLKFLLYFPAWSDILPKVAMWLHKLSKWTSLSPEYYIAFTQSLLILKDAKCFKDESNSSFLFQLFAIPAVQ